MKFDRVCSVLTLNVHKMATSHLARILLPDNQSRRSVAQFTETRAAGRAGAKCDLPSIKAPPTLPRARFLVERVNGGLKVFGNEWTGGLKSRQSVSI